MFISSRGHKFVFSTDGVSWCDPNGTWTAKADNEAGTILFPFKVYIKEEDIREKGDTIHLGAVFELRYVGPPFVYGLWLVDKKRNV